jgi:hypothetical protein
VRVTAGGTAASSGTVATREIVHIQATPAHNGTIINEPEPR